MSTPKSRETFLLWEHSSFTLFFGFFFVEFMTSFIATSIGVLSWFQILAREFVLPAWSVLCVFVKGWLELLLYVKIFYSRYLPLLTSNNLMLIPCLFPSMSFRAHLYVSCVSQTPWFSITLVPLLAYLLLYCSVVLLLFHLLTFSVPYPPGMWFCYCSISHIWGCCVPRLHRCCRRCLSSHTICCLWFPM